MAANADRAPLVEDDDLTTASAFQLTIMNWHRGLMTPDEERALDAELARRRARP